MAHRDRTTLRGRPSERRGEADLAARKQAASEGTPQSADSSGFQDHKLAEVGKDNEALKQRLDGMQKQLDAAAAEKPKSKACVIL